MQINTIAMESSMEILEKAKYKTDTWVSDITPSTQRNIRQDTIETIVHQSSLHHYPQWPSYENKPDALQLMYGSRNCGIYTYGVLLIHKEQ
jgi:hypothetical protein